MRENGGVSKFSGHLMQTDILFWIVILLVRACLCAKTIA